jgi:hypothetical protein
MSIQINATPEHFGYLVTVHGFLDSEVVDLAIDQLAPLAQDCDSVIVDLRDAVLGSPCDLTRLVDELRRRIDDTKLSFVCDRPSGRRLLRLRHDGTAIHVLRELPQPHPEAGTSRAV